MLDHAEAVRLYGPWRSRTPADAATYFAGYDRPWWVAGGWAIDAFSGTTREHGDLDIGIPRDDLGALVDFASSDLDVWAAAGSLTPMRPGEAHRLPDECENLWLRRSGADPWEYDVLLERVEGETWVFKRDGRIRRPLAECLWDRDGVRYLRPEVQLLLKAKGARPVDELDLERCLPVLDPGATSWLRDALRRAHPEHPWIGRLGRTA